MGSFSGFRRKSKSVGMTLIAHLLHYSRSQFRLCPNLHTLGQSNAIMLDLYIHSLCKNMDETSEVSKERATDDNKSERQILQAIEALFDDVHCSTIVGRLPSICLRRCYLRSNSKLSRLGSTVQVPRIIYKKILYGAKAFRTSTI